MVRADAQGVADVLLMNSVDPAVGMEHTVVSLHHRQVAVVNDDSFDIRNRQTQVLGQSHAERLVLDRVRVAGAGSLLPFWLGCIVGAVPWIAIYVVSPGTAANPPGFVYGIFVSLFILFNVFALNMWLQYRRIGPWRDYLFGERVYVLLSLTAKSALAWQVFFPTPLDS